MNRAEARDNQQQEDDRQDDERTEDQSRSPAMADNRCLELQRLAFEPRQLQGDEKVAELLARGQVAHLHLAGCALAIEIEERQSLREKFAEDDTLRKPGRHAEADALR